MWTEARLKRAPTRMGREPTPAPHGALQVHWGRLVGCVVLLVVAALYTTATAAHAIVNSRGRRDHRKQSADASIAALATVGSPASPQAPQPPPPPAPPMLLQRSGTAHGQPSVRWTGTKRWVTTELDQYASLVQEDVKSAWTGLDSVEASQKQASGNAFNFRTEQSEFYLGMSMSSLTIKTVCEVGAVSGRSAITWLESGDDVEVWSFMRPTGLEPASLEDKEEDVTQVNQSHDNLLSPGLLAETAHKYLEENYHGRFHSVVPAQSQLLDAAEVSALQARHRVPPCDAVVIYGSTLSLGVVTVGIKGGLSHADDAVMATLRNELQAMRPLAAAWHFLLVDGAPSSQNTPVANAWQQAVASKLALSYECLSAADGASWGWCLGTYRRGVDGGRAPKGLAPSSGFTPRNIHKKFLSTHDYLGVGERLESEEGKYFLTMQGDGNLVIYSTMYVAGTDTAIWSSRTPSDNRDYFLLLKADSNLAVYPGREGTVEGPPTWQTRSKGASNDDGFYIEMHDDGKLAVFKGHDPAHSTGMLRGMRPRYRSGHT